MGAGNEHVEDGRARDWWDALFNSQVKVASSLPNWTYWWPLAGKQRLCVWRCIQPRWKRQRWCAGLEEAGVPEQAYQEHKVGNSEPISWEAQDRRRFFTHEAVQQPAEASKEVQVGLQQRGHRQQSSSKAGSSTKYTDGQRWLEQ